MFKHITNTFLPPAYVVRREGNVLTRVCPSICLSTGGVPISHNALQHFPECHGADTEGVPCQVQLGGGYPARRGGTLPGGYPGGVPPRPGQDGGYPYRVPPRPGQDGGYPARRGTQLGQQKEYSLHGGWYASCVHAGGLSCLINRST